VIPSWEDVRVGTRFLRDLPGVLRHPFDLPAARRELERRLATRADALLHHVRDLARRQGPYRVLLDHAGLRSEDVAELVTARGLEEALEVIAAAGVYLTNLEMRGRTPVRRGSLTFDVKPADLIRPGAVVHGLSTTGGSRGAPAVVPIDLEFVRDHAIDTHLTLECHGGRDWAHAHWGAPGGTAVTNPIEFAAGGRPLRRWFTPIDPRARGLHSRYRAGSLAMRLGGFLGGVSLPGPTLAPLDDPMPLVLWLRDTLDAGETPHVWTFASSAVLAARAATDAGIDIEGARFTGGGEPTTRARLEAVAATGARMLPRYGATETDIIAYACAAPDSADDQHLLEDRHAVIQAPATLRDTLPEGSLLFTSLLPSAPFQLLNASLGDVAELADRDCGCPLEAMGWQRHVGRIRSFEKLTAGGITFLDVDVIRVLEETLPAAFGGDATHYQLVEDTTEPGTAPRVRLHVHPEVGDLDVEEVGDVFLAAIGGGDSGERLMELQWRGSGALKVVRAPPLRTGSGKIHHLHAV